MSGRVTNKDLYEAINDFRKEIDERYDKIEVKVDANTTFRNQLIGKMIILTGLLGFGINFVWDQLFNR